LFGLEALLENKQAGPGISRLDLDVMRYISVRFVAVVAAFLLLGARVWAADAVVATVNVPGAPFATISSHDGTVLYVSVSPVGPNTIAGVVVFRRIGGALERIGFVPLRTRAALGLALTPDDATLLVADNEGVALIDTAAAKSGHPSEPVYVVDDANAGAIEVSVTRDGRTAFVADENRASISILELKAQPNGAPGAVRTGQIAVDRAPAGLAMSADGATLYVASEVAARPIAVVDANGGELSRACERNAPNGTLSAIDVLQKTVIARVPAGCSPVRVAITADGHTAWLSVRGEDRVIGFDTVKLRTDPSHAFLSQAHMGSAPVGLALLNRDTLLAVANSNRFDPNSRTSTANVITLDGKLSLKTTFATGSFPREFSVSPDGLFLFLTNYRSGAVQVIDVSRL
jgi:DNA-binding beta-propeller fold protein YncE